MKTRIKLYSYSLYYCIYYYTLPTYRTLDGKDVRLWSLLFRRLRTLRARAYEMSVMDGTAHSFQHVHRVFKIATFLAEKEKADLELVQIGALMHDLGRAVGKPHNVTGAKLANKILLELQYPDEKRERIVRIVEFHRLSKKDDLKSLEEMVVWDADKIDLIGAVGIARVLHWGGETEQTFEYAVKWCSDNMPFVYDSLITNTAKKFAERRYEVAMTFLAALDEELSVTRC